jgi:cytoskeletal protein RodZ
MESFGQYLKSLRERQGKTLEEIAESTKIAVPNLESIEKDRYDLLPPRVFVKGFIRSYVQELGLNPSEVVEKFENFTIETEITDYVEEERVVFNKAPHSIMSSPWFTILLTGAGLICFSILVVTGFSRLFGNGSYTLAAKNKPAVETVRQSGYDISAGRGSLNATIESDFDDNASALGSKKTLEIKATANSWLRVEPDTGPAEEIVMAPGDIQIFTARDSFYLQTGNAGGIKLRLNGKDLPQYGRNNQSLSITLP